MNATKNPTTPALYRDHFHNPVQADLHYYADVSGIADDQGGYALVTITATGDQLLIERHRLTFPDGGDDTDEDRA